MPFAEMCSPFSALSLAQVPCFFIIYNQKFSEIYLTQSFTMNGQITSDISIENLFHILKL